MVRITVHTGNADTVYVKEWKAFGERFGLLSLDYAIYLICAIRYAIHDPMIPLLREAHHIILRNLKTVLLALLSRVP